jgi:septal ring factor EnvC (AmiA/AmiB activator)
MDKKNQIYAQISELKRENSALTDQENDLEGSIKKYAFAHYPEEEDYDKIFVLQEMLQALHTHNFLQSLQILNLTSAQKERVTDITLKNISIILNTDERRFSSYDACKKELETVSAKLKSNMDKLQELETEVVNLEKECELNKKI